MVMLELKLEEQPPLIQAIFSGDLEDVRTVLESKPDVNYQDAEKRSPLHAAAFIGNKELGQLLLEQGARVNTKDSKWLTPLHRACGVCADEMVDLLLKHQADTTARDRQWQTPLHIAAGHNALSCIQHLLGYISNVNVTDRSGCTALHHAALNGHNEVVELLLSRGGIVNACDKKDCRPIHWAAHLGHVDTVNILIQHGADINAKDRNQYTPLHAAVASGMVYVCSLLLSAGADVNAQNSYGNTPLHIACLNGHLSVCQILLTHNADLEATNYKGQTALHIAAASTQGFGCLAYLLEQEKVDINRQSADGRTPLHMSAIYGRFTRSKRLIDKGAVIDCADKNGNTALHIAAQYGHDILTATLLEYGANPIKRGYEGRTPLHVCCLSGYVEVCRKFLQNNIDLNIADEYGRTLIHCAAYKGSVEVLDLLVSRGANFKLQDSIGRTALHYAAARGHYNCVYTLVGIGSPVNVVDSEGCSALHLAAAYDLEGKCVEYLLQHKAAPLLKDVNGFTPVHYAVNGCNRTSLELLIGGIGKQVNFLEIGMPETTPLHLASRHSDLNILRAVIPYFPETNIKTKEGYTPLLIAAREGHTANVQMLLRFGAKVAVTDDITGMTPLHYSAKNGHLHCLALLVDNAEVKNVIDRQDKWKRTALMLAVSGAHLDCVYTLVKSNSDPNIVDADLHSSLFRAVVTDQNNVVHMLIDAGCNLRAADINGKTVLHLAAACGHLKCLQKIMQSVDEQDVLLLDKNGFSVLHWACYYGNANCLEFLIQKDVFHVMEGNPFTPVHCAAFTGSERCLKLLHGKFGVECIQTKDTRNRSPLHIAAWHGHADCVRFLLDNGGDVEARDELGRSPLISAAQNGQSQVIDLLLAHKADLKAADNNGNTAIHVACLKKHNHTALLLLEYIIDIETINMVDNDKKTALHLAARNGLVEVTAELIKKGASVTAIDNNGLTPALYCAPNACVAQCLAIILANHPTEYPAGPEHTKECMNLLHKLSKSSHPKTEMKPSQTKLSLLRNPDELRLMNEDLRHLLIKMATQQTTSPNPPRLLKRNCSNIELSSSSREELVKNAKNLVLIENYEQQDFDVSKFRTNKGGLGLHRSFSEMTLASKQKSLLEQSEQSCEEGGMIENTCQKLIEGYKSIALKMAAISSTYDVSIDDIQKAFVRHYAKRKCRRWQKYTEQMMEVDAYRQCLNELNQRNLKNVQNEEEKEKIDGGNVKEVIDCESGQVTKVYEDEESSKKENEEREREEAGDLNVCAAFVSTDEGHHAQDQESLITLTADKCKSSEDNCMDINLSSGCCMLKRTQSSPSGISMAKTMSMQTNTDNDLLQMSSSSNHHPLECHNSSSSDMQSFCDCQYVCAKCVLKNRFDTNYKSITILRPPSCTQISEDDDEEPKYHLLRYLDNYQYPENPDDSDNEIVYIPLENLMVLQPRVFIGQGAIKKIKLKKSSTTTRGTNHHNGNSALENNSSTSVDATVNFLVEDTKNLDNIPEIDAGNKDANSLIKAIDDAVSESPSWCEEMKHEDNEGIDTEQDLEHDAEMEFISSEGDEITLTSLTDVKPRLSNEETQNPGRSRRRKRRPLGGSASLTNVSMGKFYKISADKTLGGLSSITSVTSITESSDTCDLLDAATVPLTSSRFRVEKVYETKKKEEQLPQGLEFQQEQQTVIKPMETFWDGFINFDSNSKSKAKPKPKNVPTSQEKPNEHSQSLASLHFKPMNIPNDIKPTKPKLESKILLTSPILSSSLYEEELHTALQKAQEKMKHLTYKEFVSLSKNLKMSKEAKAMAQKFIEQMAHEHEEQQEVNEEVQGSQGPHRVESKHALLEGVKHANSADSGLDSASLDSLSAEDVCLLQEVFKTEEEKDKEKVKTVVNNSSTRRRSHKKQDENKCRVS